MKKLNRPEAWAVSLVLEKVLEHLEEWEKGHYSTTEDLLIGMDEDDLYLLKNAQKKLKAGIN
jgi:hypothetical protein